MPALVPGQETCPLCGAAFDAEGQGCRPSCPMSKGCHVVCCPSCGYSLPAGDGGARRRAASLPRSLEEAEGEGDGEHSVTGPVPRRLEEILEHVFTEREEGRDAPAAILAASTSRPRAGRARRRPRGARRGGARPRSTDDHVLLTPEGEAAGEGRRAAAPADRAALPRPPRPRRTGHGGARPASSSTSSRREATDSVCTLLGHPPTCPHGKPIPPGECCGAFQRTVRPLVTGPQDLRGRRDRPDRLHRAEVPRPDGPPRRPRRHPGQRGQAPPARPRPT